MKQEFGHSRLPSGTSPATAIPLVRLGVRGAYRRLVAQGWTDALRALRPNARIYTFWRYFFGTP